MHSNELKEIERRMDELAREFAAAHDPAVKRKIEDLSRISAALDVFVDALDRCRTEDMRTPKIVSALDYLESQSATKWPFEQFREALDNTNEEGRWQLLNAPLNGIKEAIKSRTNLRPQRRTLK